MMLKKKEFNLSIKNSLFILFLIGLSIRFFYFPNNVYFGFDQARDAFISQDILKGHLKIIGPTTSIPGLNHGPLYYYIYAPIYFLSGGNPAWVSAFLRIMNTSGLFLIYIISSILFGSTTGLISAFLYTFSFEQSQYAIYFNHPSFGIISVMLFYLGLSKLIYENKKSGFLLAMIGLGLSLQFEFVLIYLLLFLAIFYCLYLGAFLNLGIKTYTVGLLIFGFFVSSFTFAEYKYHNLLNYIQHQTKSQFSFSNDYIKMLQKTLSLLTTFIKYNFISNNLLAGLLLIVLIGCFFYLLKRKEQRKKLIFLLVWLSGSLVTYLSNKSPSPLFYYTLGGSLALLIFSSFLLTFLIKYSKKIFVVVLLIIISSNMYLIVSLNQKGPLPSINVQTGMLLENEKDALDFVYKTAQSSPFAVNALTMPFLINTTWSYLFEWYGKNKYHSLPVWGGEVASGYPGRLKVESSRSALPVRNFLIIEPLRGIPENLRDNFLREESYFSKVLDEKKFGDIVVQVREKI